MLADQRVNLVEVAEVDLLEQLGIAGLPFVLLLTACDQFSEFPLDAEGHELWIGGAATGQDLVVLPLHLALQQSAAERLAVPSGAFQQHPP